MNLKKHTFYLFSFSCECRIFFLNLYNTQHITHNLALIFLSFLCSFSFAEQTPIYIVEGTKVFGFELLTQNTDSIYVLENTLVTGSSDHILVKNVPSKKIYKNKAIIPHITKTVSKTTPRYTYQKQVPSRGFTSKQTSIIAVVLPIILKKSIKNLQVISITIYQSMMLAFKQTNWLFYPSNLSCYANKSYHFFGYMPPPLQVINSIFKNFNKA